MGYRSKVVALVYPTPSSVSDGVGPVAEDTYEQLKLLMNTTFKDMFEYWGDHFQWRDAAHTLQFETDGVKWYPSYTEVTRFENFLREVEDLGYATEFIRLGEDYNDIETRYGDGCHYKLGVERTVVCEL